MNDPHVPDGIRLQKVLANVGVASRRGCEQLILAGRVSVNGDVIKALGTRIDPDSAVIHVDGTRVVLNSRNLTLALNKPRGVVCSMQDEEGRPDLSDYTRKYKQRLYHVGRLDTDTEGLILLTNDGDLAYRLTHPSWEVPKTYQAIVKGKVGPGLGRVLRGGIELEDGSVQVDKFHVRGRYQGMSDVEITLHEGRNRIVRRLMAEVGHPVQRLVRTSFGTIQLDDLKPGRVRVIQDKELGKLMTEVGL